MGTITKYNFTYANFGVENLIVPLWDVNFNTATQMSFY